MEPGMTLEELRQIFLSAPASDATRLVTVLLSVGLLSCVLWLVRRGVLREEFTPVWLGISVSLLAVSLYSGFRLGARSWEAGETQAAQTEELRVVSRFLESSLSRAMGLAFNARNRRRVWFDGEPDRLGAGVALDQRGLGAFGGQLDPVGGGRAVPTQRDRVTGFHVAGV